MALLARCTLRGRPPLGPKATTLSRTAGNGDLSHCRRPANPCRPSKKKISVPTVAQAGAGAAATEDGAACAGLRRSPDVVRKEIASCYEVVERMGKGVLYLGSARTSEAHPHFQLAKALSQDISGLLGGVTTWSGMGAGMMEAANQGAMAAGSPAAGFKIFQEGGKWVGLDGSWEHPYLPQEAYVTCEFFSARKHGLAEAATRSCAEDRTAIVILPGGTGTLDEVFELVVLMQLDKLGTEHPVPLLLMNYDGFYDNLLGFFTDAVEYGAIGRDELSSLLTVCTSNDEALAHLADFYSLSN